MRFIKNIWFFLFLAISYTSVYAQTAGFNYQALILNTEVIQVPGTDINKNNIPLRSKEIRLRFTISKEDDIEYIEEQTLFTDENGMVSTIVGEGVPKLNTFNDILWDGKTKYLNVELNILDSNNGFVFLDSQKILYTPHPSNGSKVKVVDTIQDLTGQYNIGDLAWIKNYAAPNTPVLTIWDGSNWVAVANNSSSSGLVVVANNTDRDNQFSPPVVGNQVWNQDCACMEVYDGSNWVNISNTLVGNGLTKQGNIIKLGGALTQPTTFTTTATNTLAIKGLQESTSTEDTFIVADKNTGVLKQTALKPSFTQQKQVVIYAKDGQLDFPTPYTITDQSKIDVYRNGVRVEFSKVDNNTIQLEPEAECYQNDKIRIVQLY